MLAWMAIIFFILLILGFPIFANIVIAGVSTLLIFFPNIQTTIAIQKMVTGVDTFSLMAVPFFMFAAEIISKGEIGKQLISFAKVLVGHLTGGMALVTVLACLIFGAISGAGAAAIVALGPLIFPALISLNYEEGFSLSLILSSSTLAMLIPPGIAMILYATLTNNSVGAIFMGGLSAGLIMGIAYMIYGVVYAYVHKLPKMERATFKDFLLALKNSGFSLGLPVIILGGIYGGIMTPTESAAVAVIYAIVVEMFIHRQISFKDLYNIAVKTGSDVSMIMILIAAGSLLSWVITLAQVPNMIVNLIGGMSPLLLLFSINIVLLIAGMFIDVNSAVILLVPLIYPAAMAVHLDPIHLGIIMVTNLSIGMMTPPFGLNLFVSAATFERSYASLIKPLIPFILISIAVLMIITYIPSIALFFPKLIGLI